jgi:hypothetical protein
MMARWLPLLVVGACCGRPAQKPSPSSPEDSVKVGVTIPREYLLAFPVKDPLERIERYPGAPAAAPSSEFAASYALFEEGHRAYTAKDYLGAAELWLRAARTLTVRTGIHADTAGRNRSALYEDAAYAWLMAGVTDRGRATLERLQADGTATAADVRRALDALAAP